MFNMRIDWPAECSEHSSKHRSRTQNYWIHVHKRMWCLCLWSYVIVGFLVQVASAGSNLPLLSGTLRTFQVHACDGNELKIECWPNTIINVYLAQYGRQVTAHQVCPPEGVTEEATVMPFNDTTNCLSSHALRTVEEACREQRICKVKTSPQTFGSDPCPGVRKYAEVAYKCRPNVFSNKVVCEGDRLRLRCHRNLRIVIYSAAFGATHYGVPECPQPGGEQHIEDCQVSYATEAVMSSCHGRRKCSIGADVGTFGKPGCPPGTRLFLKVVHTCVPREILKDLDIGGVDDKDQEDSDYTGFIEEPRYVPPATTGPVSDTTTPPNKMASTFKPQLEEGVTKTDTQQTTVKTDMQSDENSGEEGDASTNLGGDQKVIGFFTEWVSAYNFIKENKEKFILYLTLSLSIAVLLVLVILTTKFYIRRARRLREERAMPPKPPIPDTPTSGGISPFGEDCTDLDHFDNPARDSGVEVVRFATRSSLRRAQPIEDDDCSFPRAVRSQNNYFYS